MIKLIDIVRRILSEDTGASGKEFEAKFIEALELVGLEFDVNRSSGALWDIRPTGEGWNRLISEKDVNIKVARTKWMFGSAELSNMIPWDDASSIQNVELYKKRIRRLLKSKGVQDTLFLKPKSDAVQNKIMQAVAVKDVDTLNQILVRDNFLIEKLGNNYDIRILAKGNRITSIVFDKGGKVFMRSERPRQVGGSSGFVAFKSATPQISDKPRPVIK